MNLITLIRKIQDKINTDPAFAAKFQQASNVVSNMPGLQQEVLRIAQIQDEKAQQQAIDRLPQQAKDAVRELISMLNS